MEDPIARIKALGDKARARSKELHPDEVEGAQRAAEHAASLANMSPKFSPLQRGKRKLKETPREMRTNHRAIASARGFERRHPKDD